MDKRVNRAISNLLTIVLLVAFWVFGSNIRAQMFLDSPVAQSPAGSQIALARADGQIELLDTSSNQVIYTLSAHTDRVIDLAWSHDESYLASGGFDNTVYVWDVTTGNLLYPIPFQQSDEGTITVLTWSPDDSKIIVGYAGDSGAILSVWDTTNQRFVLDLPTGFSLELSWSPDEQTLAVGTEFGLELIDWTSKTRVNRLVLDPIMGATQVFAIAWHPDGTNIALGSLGGNVRVWNIPTDQIVSEYQASNITYDVRAGDNLLTSQIRALSFNADGTQLLSFSGDGVLKTWDWNSNALINEANVDVPVYGADFNADGSKLFYLDSHKSIASIEP